MKNLMKIAGLVLLAAILGAPLFAAGRSGGKELVINYPTFQSGVNTAAPVVEQLVKEFNQQYAGRYRIVKEDVPGDQNYVDKITVQINSGDLPPVIYGGGYNLLDLALARDLAVDLTAVVNGDPAWKALFSQAALDTNSRNGKIYAASSEGSVIGYFYNKELFTKAGISAPAKTWDEFFAQCEQLKKAGITPLALDTADSAWVSSLWMGAMVATESPAGLSFMKQMNPRNYNTPEMIKAATQIQRMFQNYTTKDAVGGAYEHAANNFLSGNVAMIANGPWMLGDFEDTTKTSAGFAAKVGAAVYPGSFVYDAPIQGYVVTKQRDPALQEAAIEMVKFFTSAHAQQVALEIQGMVPASPTVPLDNAAKQKWPLLADFLAQANAAQSRSDNLQATMYSNLLDIVSQELPRLAQSQITPQQFCQLLTDGAAKN